MKPYLLFLILTIFPARLFPQNPCRTDSIVVIKENIRSDSAKRPEIATLIFEPSSKTRYAFDEYRDIYSKVTEYFQKYKPLADAMIASAKFIAVGESDELFVRIRIKERGRV